MWLEDSHIDETELSRESLRTPNLHAKYLRIYGEESLRLRSLMSKRKQIQTKLSDYYGGKFDEDLLAELNREPAARKYLKQDIPGAIENDDEYIRINTRIQYQEELVEVLKEILKAIHNRGYNIKNSIDFLKLTNGM